MNLNSHVTGDMMKVILDCSRFLFLRKTLRLCCLCLFLGSPYASAQLEFLSVTENAVVMYDAPSLKADKLFVVGLYFPVEAIVHVEGWVKVRDSSGSLAWIEKKFLSDQKYVIVTTAVADVHQSTDVSSPVVFQAVENVILEWLDSDTDGWVKVRHKSGNSGFVRTNQVWGS